MNTKYKASFFTVSAALLLYTLCSLLPAASFAQGAITYIERFADNSNGWWVGNTDKLKAEIKDNKYILFDNLPGASYFWIRLPIDQEKDFQIESDMMSNKRLQEESWFGIEWGGKGGRDGQPMYIHTMGISNTGHYRYGKYLVDRWEKEPKIYEIPHINKGYAVINRLKIRKSGDWIELYINNQFVEKIPHEPFFGNQIGFEANEAIAYNLIVTIPSDNIPTGITVVNEGNFKSKFTWINSKDEKRFWAEVFRNGNLALNKPFSGDNATVSAQVKSPSVSTDSSCGVYMQMEGGAMLKLERIETSKGVMARFSASSEGKDMGSKEVIIPNKDISLKLLREKDAFKGEVSVDGTMMEVGSLKWPNLSINQWIGVITSYKSTNQNAPASMIYEFNNFYAGKQ